MTGNFGRDSWISCSSSRPTVAGHAYVCDQHIRNVRAQGLERSIGVLESLGEHSALLQGTLEDPADGRIIINEPHVQGSNGHSRSLWEAGW